MLDDALVMAALDRRADQAVGLVVTHYRKTGAFVGVALVASPGAAQVPAERKRLWPDG
jgi:hypothetical protein